MQSPLLRRLRASLEEVAGHTYVPSPGVAAQVRHRAAVLVLLLPRVGAPPPASDWWPEEAGPQFDLLLTRRSLALRHYPGHTAFPGGKMDPGDLSVIHTALREAHEEVGVRPDEVTVLGVLPPLLTRHGHLTYGVVGFLDEPDRRWRRPVNDMETDDVFRVPLHRFLSTRATLFYRAPTPFAQTPLIFIGMADWIEEGERRRRETWGLTVVFAIVTAMLAYGRKPDFPLFYITGNPARQGDSLQAELAEWNDGFAAMMETRAKL